MTDKTVDDSTESVSAPDADVAENGTSSEAIPANAYPDPRPLTQADELRAAVMSKIFDSLTDPETGLPLKTVEATAGRSLVLTFGDESRLLIQAAAISSEAELQFDFEDDAE